LDNLNRFNWFFRRLTAHLRQLPNCYIVGAQKAGTSSLYHYLIQHPLIHKSYLKEVHYFDGGLNPEIDNYKRNLNWYKAHFSIKKNKNAINIDATPFYLFHPQVPKRIASLTPEAKIIILLRNPVHRAISHYYHVKRHGFETLPITEAFEMESLRLAHAYQTKDYKDINFRLYSYKARGLYLDQIKRYHQVFNKNQTLIIDSNDLFLNTEKTINTVFKFLNLPIVKIPDLQSKNVGKNKQHIDAEFIHQLYHYYAEHNEQLFDYLGKRFNWQD
jgi:hypothetical protein